MTDFKTGAVTAVYADATTGQVFVNVATGGPDGTPRVPVFNPGYTPVVGHNALIVEIDTGSWVCLGASNPPVAAAKVPTFTVQDVAPSATDWSQISTVYARKFILGQPDLVLVRSAAPTPPAGGTIVQAAIGSKSYGDLYGWRTDSSRVYQGTYGFGVHSGLWFYPSLVSTLSGKTPTRFRIDVYRASSGGSAGPVQLHFYLHNHASQPAGAPTFTAGPIEPSGSALSWGATATLDLPVAWATAIKAGTAAGVGIYATSMDEYSILQGIDLGDQPLSGRLTIDYT